MGLCGMSVIGLIGSVWAWLGHEMPQPYLTPPLPSSCKITWCITCTLLSINLIASEVDSVQESISWALHFIQSHQWSWLENLQYSQRQVIMSYIYSVTCTWITIFVDLYLYWSSCKGPHTSPRLKPTANCLYPTTLLPLVGPVWQKSCTEHTALTCCQLHSSVYILHLRETQ